MHGFQKLPCMLAPQLWETPRGFLINICPGPSVFVALALQDSFTRLPGLAILEAQLILATHQHSFIFCVQKQVANTPDCRIDFWSVPCWRCRLANCSAVPTAQRPSTSTTPSFAQPHLGVQWGPVLICYWCAQSTAQCENPAPGPEEKPLGCHQRSHAFPMLENLFSNINMLPHEALITPERALQPISHRHPTLTSPVLVLQSIYSAQKKPLSPLELRGCFSLLCAHTPKLMLQSPKAPSPSSALSFPLFLFHQPTAVQNRNEYSKGTFCFNQVWGNKPTCCFPS